MWADDDLLPLNDPRQDEFDTMCSAYYDQPKNEGPDVYSPGKVMTWETTRIAEKLQVGHTVQLLRTADRTRFWDITTTVNEYTPSLNKKTVQNNTL